MDTSREREHLIAWMAENGHTAQTLFERMDYSLDRVNDIVTGKKRITQYFMYAIGACFGNKAFQRAFGLPETANYRDVETWYPERFAARRALAKAIKNGEMLPAKAHKCHNCDEQAHDYHHPSYAPGDELCVVPLCSRCHLKVHREGMPLDLGVVPTYVGLVRIAIATAP